MYNATTKLLLALLLGLGTLAHATTGAKRLHPQTQHVMLTGRFLAEVPLTKRVSVGPNYKSYLFELNDSGAGRPAGLIKLSYRFYLTDPEIPRALLDYSLLHKFNMLRDATCDETFASLAETYRFDAAGNFQGSGASLVYSDGAPTLSRLKDEQVLCYVITPNDYRATMLEVNSKATKTIDARSEVAR